MSERLYSLLLRLYPRSFRDRYADEMRRLFHDRLAHEHAAVVWLDVLADALVSIPLQHLRSRQPDPMLPPSAARLRTTVVTATSLMFVAGMLFGTSLVASVFRLWPLTAAMALAAAATAFRSWRTGRAVRSYRAGVGIDSVTVQCDALGIAPLTLWRSEVRTTVTPLFRVALSGDVAAWQIAALTIVALVSSLSIAAGLTTGTVVATVAGGVSRRRLPARALLLLLPVGIVLARWIW